MHYFKTAYGRSIYYQLIQHLFELNILLDTYNSNLGIYNVNQGTTKLITVWGTRSTEHCYSTGVSLSWRGDGGVVLA